MMIEKKKEREKKKGEKKEKKTNNQTNRRTMITMMLILLMLMLMLLKHSLSFRKSELYPLNASCSCSCSYPCVTCSFSGASFAPPPRKWLKIRWGGGGGDGSIRRSDDFRSLACWLVDWLVGRWIRLVGWLACSVTSLTTYV